MCGFDSSGKSNQEAPNHPYPEKLFHLRKPTKAGRGTLFPVRIRLGNLQGTTNFLRRAEKLFRHCFRPVLEFLCTNTLAASDRWPTDAGNGKDGGVTTCRIRFASLIPKPQELRPRKFTIRSKRTCAVTRTNRDLTFFRRCHLTRRSSANELADRLAEQPARPGALPNS
jgi:hypothetical protein